MRNMKQDKTLKPENVAAGKRLKEARELAGYGQAKDFYEKFGINQGTFSGHESGQRGIKPPQAKKYADSLGNCSSGWILTGEGDRPTSMAMPDAPAKETKNLTLPRREMERPTPSDVGERLKFARIRRMTKDNPQDAADGLEWPIEDLLAYESGQTSIPADRLVSFSNNFDVSVDFILFGTVEALSHKLQESWIKYLNSSRK